MDTNPEIMCTLGGPEVAAFKQACMTTTSGAASRSWRRTPAATRSTPASSSTNHGELKLYYRKLHPWVPVEPWEPGDLGIPVIDGPKGCKLSLIICHDGMFPEMAREAAYKGAEIMLRTAGYTAPIRDSWKIHQPVQRLLQPDGDGERLHVRFRRTFDSMGEGMVCNFDGSIIAHGTTGRVNEIITAEVRPDLVREARVNWGVENNIYQLGHRAYGRGEGRRAGLPYTYMHDLAAGKYRLPWEDEVVHTDGTSCGFPAPTRSYSPMLKSDAAE